MEKGLKYTDKTSIKRVASISPLKVEGFVAKLLVSGGQCGD